jgi:hypothetical protein
MDERRLGHGGAQVAPDRRLRYKYRTSRALFLRMHTICIAFLVFLPALAGTVQEACPECRSLKGRP